MKQTLSLFALTAFMAGCSSQTPPDSANDAELSASPDASSTAASDDTTDMAAENKTANENDNKYTRIEADEKVFFNTDSAELLDSGREKLDAIAAMYDEDGDAWKNLRISGHADHRGTEAYNMDLSRERAKSVRTYLVSKGIPAEKIDLKAYGEEQPAIPAAEEPAELQKNRRVVFDLER